MKKFFQITLFVSLFTVSLNATTKIHKHKVKSGESLYSIAHKYKTTIKAIKKLNGMKEGSILKAGKIVKVRIDAKTPIGQKSIKKRGKSLRRVLNKHAQPLRKKRNLYTFDDVSFRKIGFDFGFAHKKSKKIIALAKQKLGRKYVWGAVGEKGTFDCSGLTKYVFEKNGIHIPRTSFNQSKYGKYISRKNLKKGDLIFFDTSKERKGIVNHVGIYLGNGKFIHASSAKKKVVISRLNKFYASRYKGARRPG